MKESSHDSQRRPVIHRPKCEVLTVSIVLQHDHPVRVEGAVGGENNPAFLTRVSSPENSRFHQRRHFVETSTGGSNKTERE
jgi:hypothetical protein